MIIFPDVTTLRRVLAQLSTAQRLALPAWWENQLTKRKKVSLGLLHCPTMFHTAECCKISLYGMLNRLTLYNRLSANRLYPKGNKIPKPDHASATVASHIKPVQFLRRQMHFTRLNIRFELFAAMRSHHREEIHRLIHHLSQRDLGRVSPFSLANRLARSRR